MKERESARSQQAGDAAPLRGSPSSTSRRSFLARAMAAGGGLALLNETGVGWGREPASAAVPQSVALPAGKDAENFIAHSPLTFETKREAFGTSTIVPADLLFVRNHLPTPEASFVANRDEWMLTVDGVRNPRGIRVGELKTLGVETVATVLQCSGNGRGFFDHQTSGSQWGVGAAACVVWSGVPVRALIEALGGPGMGARFVTGTGGEVIPAELNPDQATVERSIPLGKGIEDALLAWEMNGEPLPLVHGGPLRLVVPGYFGVNQIKYVKRLALTAEESGVEVMQTGYRFRPIGEFGAPNQPTMWEMSVKSWINHPSGELTVPAGRVVIDGVAFGGMRPVRRVEVSVDGGRTWREAPFVGPDLGRYAWRQFTLAVTLGRGTHTLASRATDEAGNVQPADRAENDRGYGNTSWRDHAVTVAVV